MPSITWQILNPRFGINLIVYMSSIIHILDPNYNLLHAVPGITGCNDQILIFRMRGNKEMSINGVTVPTRIIDIEKEKKRKKGLQRFSNSTVPCEKYKHYQQTRAKETSNLDVNGKNFDKNVLNSRNAFLGMVSVLCVTWVRGMEMPSISLGFRYPREWRPIFILPSELTEKP